MSHWALKHILSLSILLTGVSHLAYSHNSAHDFRSEINPTATSSFHIAASDATQATFQERIPSKKVLDYTFSLEAVEFEEEEEEFFSSKKLAGFSAQFNTLYFGLSPPFYLLSLQGSTYTCNSSLLYASCKRFIVLRVLRL